MAKERKNDTYAEFKNRRNAYADFDSVMERRMRDGSLLQHMFSRGDVPAEATAAPSEEQHTAAGRDESRDSGRLNSSRASK